MSRVPFTLRIGLDERSALQHMSEVEGRPINQLLNEAIKMYLSRKGQKEQALESSMAKLRAYRKRDPGFEKAMAAFVEAEATQEDPIEGEPFEAESAEDQLKADGPIQSRVREILGA
jgi:predicted transcriptional regulator